MSNEEDRKKMVIRKPGMSTSKEGEEARADLSKNQQEVKKFFAERAAARRRAAQGDNTSGAANVPTLVKGEKSVVRVAEMTRVVEKLEEEHAKLVSARTFQQPDPVPPPDGTAKRQPKPMTKSKEKVAARVAAILREGHEPRSPMLDEAKRRGDRGGGQ